MGELNEPQYRTDHLYSSSDPVSSHGVTSLPRPVHRPTERNTPVLVHCWQLPRRFTDQRPQWRCRGPERLASMDSRCGCRDRVTRHYGIQTRTSQPPQNLDPRLTQGTRAIR